jgi:hypothetical protein
VKHQQEQLDKTSLREKGKFMPRNEPKTKLTEAPKLVLRPDI